MSAEHAEWIRTDLTGDQLREMYLSFFRARGHAILPSASLIPDGDASVLFTTAGMHPLVPYLLGQPHPAGARLADCQKCVRTSDIEEVGDRTHLTFFEMLGNWSLGDYYKAESIRWSFEFLTGANELALPPGVLWVTCFAGDANAPRDAQSAALWRSLGIPDQRIVFLGAEHNWWAAGPEGPCGPDTEIFVDRTGTPCAQGADACLPGLCGCGRFFEVWNNVFMSYQRRAGVVSELPKKNVDTGMGLERTLAALNDAPSVYETASFRPILERLVESSSHGRDEIHADAKLLRALRIVSDHLRTSVFIIGDQRGVTPSNQGQGYVLRRLIRRAIRYCQQLALPAREWIDTANVVIQVYGAHYTELVAKRAYILNELALEQRRFEKTLSTGTALLSKEIELLRAQRGVTTISGDLAFRLYDTYGFPPEFTSEIAKEHGLDVDLARFAVRFEEHKVRSRSEAAKSGLADDSPESVRYHTATHLLHTALRTVLGSHVQQRGSNITRERMRFDFAHPAAMTPEQVRQVEALVQSYIDQDVPVTRVVTSAGDARAMGAIGLFGDKYGDDVSIYRIGDISLEFCGGPHVERTGEIGRFKVEKEQSSSAGVRRIRATIS